MPLGKLKEEKNKKMERDKINERLTLIEKDKKSKILFACESGSRAWGFASPDSDYDVRFIYTKPIDWYLSVSDKKDFIDIMDGDFDAVGWELRKQLRLMVKSNIPALEHLFSPIIYKENTVLVDELREIGKECFSPIKSMYHYLSMSKNYLERLEGENIKLKDLFYALRTSLAGRWILENKTLPPIIFEEMLGLVDKNIEDQIRSLMWAKSENNEDYFHVSNVELIRTISEIISVNNKNIKGLPNGKPNSERINSYLCKIVTDENN